MVLFPVPTIARDLHERLWDNHKIEIPGIEWRGGQYLRLSCQLYTTKEHIDKLVAALRIELKKPE
jgi:selenocysteine lyase/cysteine desulfurase